MAAVPAEVNRVQLDVFFLPARCEALGIQGDVPYIAWLQCGQYHAGAADELVKLEGKGRTPLWGADVVGGQQKARQGALGLVRAAAGIAGKSLTCFFQGYGAGAANGAGVVRNGDAQRQFHPDGEWVVLKCLVIGPRVLFASDSCEQVMAYGVDITVCVCDPFQRFSDDLVLGDARAKQFAGDFCHDPVALRFTGCAGHGGRSTDAHQSVGIQPFAQTAHQQGDIGALTAPVGMQFIQHQKLQPSAMLDDLPVSLRIARQDVFQHHEVGEQDVRGTFGDALPFCCALLAGVAGHGDGAIQIVVAVKELVQLFELAVGQGIHRVDDDGTGARRTVRFPRLEDAVDDGNEERK